MIAPANVDNLSVRRHFGTVSRHASRHIVRAFDDQRTLKGQWPGYEVVDHRSESLTRHALENIDEQHVSDVRVRKPFAWCEQHALRQYGVKKLLSRPRSTWVGTNRFVILGQRPVIAKAARMTKQMRERDGVGNIHIRQPLPGGIDES